MDKIREFVNSLGFPFDTRENDYSITMTIPDSTSFSDVYNKIALNKDFTQDSQQVTTSKTSFIYTDGEIEVSLKADYDRDIYEAIFSER